MYPNSEQPYVMNTGIRSREAESGALIVAEPRGGRAAADAIQQTLLRVRPYGGTPIAEKPAD